MNSMTAKMVQMMLALAAGGFVGWALSLPVCSSRQDRRAVEPTVAPVSAPVATRDRWSTETVETYIARCVRNAGRMVKMDEDEKIGMCRKLAVDECVRERDAWKDCYRWVGEPVPEYLPKR